MKSVKIKGGQSGLSGSLSFPGDKSLSHRAIIFGSLAEGKSRFTNVLAGEDCVCTRKAFEAMGVKIESSKGGTELTIHGAGLNGLKAPKSDLYCGNSGTSMRLLMGVLAGQRFSAALTGDPSLSGRPMDRVGKYLRQMGATVEYAKEGKYAPIRIQGGKLKAIDAQLPVASAQVKSAILLAGLYADGETRVAEPVKSRDHTERFLRYFGAKIKEIDTAVSLNGKQSLAGKSFAIPGDISSAAFFMAMAVLAKNSRIEFKNVLANPTRSGINNVLERCGGVRFGAGSVSGGPEIALSTELAAQPSLKAFEIKKEELPSLIDEIPVLCVLATQAQGESAIRDADELRVKESDRIATVISLLKPMGADIRAEGNTIYVKGPTGLKGAKVNSKKDHRIAMAGVVAGLIAEGETIVEDIDCIDTSFPSFFNLLKEVKGSFQIIH